MSVHIELVSHTGYEVMGCGTVCGVEGGGVLT